MMDDARLIAWIDGELEPAEAEAVAAAVAANPALAAKAEAHRRLKARIVAAFGPLLEEPVRLPDHKPAPVLWLASARAEAAKTRPTPGSSRWAWPVALAASLVLGLLVGHQLPGSGGIGDRPGALSLSPEIASALDTQAAGQGGPVHVALSFQDRAGAYCRSFTAAHVGGVACHEGDGWRLRYASPAALRQGAYRMAGDDAATMQVIETMIAGKPLDAAEEQKARAAQWKAR